MAAVVWTLIVIVNRCVWDETGEVSAVDIAASQLHSRRMFLLSLEFKGFLKPKLQRPATVREGSVGNLSDALFHTGDRFRVLEGGNQKFALHLCHLLLAEEKVSSALTSSSKVRQGKSPYLAVIHENASSTTLSEDNLLLMSAKALSLRASIPNLDLHVNLV